MLRLLHLAVIASLVLAAAYVYKIKFEAAAQAERLAKVRREIHHERDAIALLKAEWAKLDNPMRIQNLVENQLDLQPVQATQFGDIGKLPPRPPQLVPPDSPDPIAALIDKVERAEQLTTGSIAAKPPAASLAQPAPSQGH